jgi:hypothetical protein
LQTLSPHHFRNILICKMLFRVTPITNDENIVPVLIPAYKLHIK